MPNPDREIDKTHLSVNNAESRGFIHRDYIAHCLRWSHVCKYMGIKNKYKTARILDVGCGRELPLLTTLYTSRMSPQYYEGVEANKMINCPTLPAIEKKMGPENVHINLETDFAQLEEEEFYSLDEEGFNTIICFEVLEHVTPRKVLNILKNIRRLMDEEAVAFISTPCYNGKAAVNHINEMKYEVMGALFESNGFEIMNHWGTFASRTDIDPELNSFGLHGHIYQKLKEYYDANYLSTIFAPLCPEQSRNVLWKIRISTDNLKPCQFPYLQDIEEPWSSSLNWRDLNNA